jgi:hypothetical protein
VDVGSGVGVSVGRGVAVGAGVSVGTEVAVGGSAVGGALQACSTSSKRKIRYRGRFMVFSFLEIDTVSLSQKCGSHSIISSYSFHFKIQ